MPLPTLRQLQYFVTTAKIGTLAGAAAEHHIAQPSLSEQISTLERTINVTLFTRTSRGLLLTDAGKQLLSLAQKTLNGAKEFSEWSRGIHDIKRGTVSFGTFNSAHQYLLPPLIRDFLKQHPSVRVNVRGLNSAEVAESVKQGDLEAGLVQLPVDDRELKVSLTPFQDPLIYASIHPENTDKPVDIDTLVKRTLILNESRWADQDPMRITLQARTQRAGLSLEPKVEVEFHTHAIELALHGIGDCLISYHVAKDLITAGRITWTLLDPPLDERYAFITRKNGSISPATAAFMHLAANRLEDLTQEQKQDKRLSALRFLSQRSSR